jgi:cytoskeletal protein RodZ
MSKDERTHARLAMTMAEDRQVDFGTFLRQAREQRGVTLQDLAVATKISARVLECLERNDPSKLPGGIFSRAFVRAYAREVGVDAEAAVARFVAAFPEASGADEMPSTTSAVEVESFEQRRHAVTIAARVLGVAVLVAVAGFVVYYAGFMPGAKRAEPAAVQPPAPQAVSPAPAPPRSPLPAPSAASSEAAAVPAAEGVQDAAVPPPEEPEPALPAAAEPLPAEARQPGAASTASAPLAVLLSTTGDCWLSVSVDGTRMPSRMMTAGERIEFTVQRSITMTAGNAGVLAVTLNGKPARSFGGAGVVVTRTITASAYEAFLR